MGYGLGVDLGTSFTGVAIGRNGRTRIVPLSDDPISVSSLVAVRPPGSLLVREIDETVPVVLGGRPYPAVAVLAETLRLALASVTASEGEPPEQVVLTCPAVWGPARRQQFGEVSRRAGLTSVTVVSEPEAAVTGLVDGRRLVEDDVVLVYDIGGVTVDMTIVRVTDSGMEILGLPEGADGAGGADFDDLILAHVDRLVGGALSELDLTDPVAVGVLTGVRAECVRAKQTLSWSETATVRVIGLAEVVGLNEELPPIVLARPDFEAMIRKPLTSTLAGVRRVLDSAGIEAMDLTAVLLVGGSSRIPLVSRMLTKSLGRPVLVDEHPQHCVALGAAAIAGGTSTIADGVRRITPGAPPITDSIPTIAAAAAKVAAAKSAEPSKSAESRAGKKAAGRPGKAKVAAGKSVAGKAAAGKSLSGRSGVGKSAVGKSAVGKSVVGKSVGKSAVGKTAVGPSAAGDSALSKSAFTVSPSDDSTASTRAAAALAPIQSFSNSAFSGPAFSAASTNSSFSPPVASIKRPSLDEIADTFPGGRSASVDVTVPVLSRRAGGHRMPRVADWRRWVGAERYGVEVQPWRVVLITTVTALLIGGGTYAFAPLGGDDPADVNAQVVDPPFVAPPSELPAVIETPSETPTETEPPVATTTAAPTRTKAPVKTDPPRRSTAPPTSRPTWSVPITAPITGTGLLVVGLGGRCLDVPEGRAEDDTPVQIFGCNGSPAQIWTLSADGSVQAVGKCLQIVDLSNENSRLKINTCNGRGSQQWVLDSGKLVNPATSRCLDVAGNSAEDRTPVITDPCDGGAGQSWSLRSRNRW